MAPAPRVFEIVITVQASDIDHLGHVNNVAYLRWVQEAAVAQWTAEAPPADQANLLWMVLRHEVDYLKAAYLADEIIARTWVGEASRLRFERFTEIVRSSDSTLLVKAKTIWCPIDAKRMRPVAVSDEVRARFSQPAGHTNPQPQGSGE